MLVTGVFSLLTLSSACADPLETARRFFEARFTGFRRPSSTGSMRNFKIRSAWSVLRPVDGRQRMSDMERSWSFFNLEGKKSCARTMPIVIGTWLTGSNTFGIHHCLGRIQIRWILEDSFSRSPWPRRRTAWMRRTSVKRIAYSSSTEADLSQAREGVGWCMCDSIVHWKQSVESAWENRLRVYRIRFRPMVSHSPRTRVH